MRTRRQVPAKAKRAVPLELPVPRPKALQELRKWVCDCRNRIFRAFYAESFPQGFHEASKRVSAIDRKLAKLEEQKADLEQQMAAHDPSDYEGLGKLNDQLSSRHRRVRRT